MQLQEGLEDKTVLCVPLLYPGMHLQLRREKNEDEQNLKCYHSSVPRFECLAKFSPNCLLQDIMEGQGSGSDRQGS